MRSNLPAQGTGKLDRIRVSDYDYSGVKVVKSAVITDHTALVLKLSEQSARVGVSEFSA